MSKIYKAEIPAEPPVGTKVRDVGGSVYERIDSSGVSWFPTLGGQGRRWEGLLRTHGPLTDLTPLKVWETPPEPPIGTKVSDREGDTWTRTEKGWQYRDEGSGRLTWADVMAYAPLTEVR